ncbi:hypothetical protein BJ165DRAFT_1592295 [Panaeolus papilionaceus]|nr:hypothetical protein BJ165DRAFT_1592295 [Panaeolus papilionaceus]
MANELQVTRLWWQYIIIFPWIVIQLVGMTLLMHLIGVLQNVLWGCLASFVILDECADSAHFSHSIAQGDMLSSAQTMKVIGVGQGIREGGYYTGTYELTTFGDIHRMQTYRYDLSHYLWHYLRYIIFVSIMGPTGAGSLKFVGVKEIGGIGFDVLHATRASLVGGAIFFLPSIIVMITLFDCMLKCRIPFAMMVRTLVETRARVWKIFFN